MRHERVPGDAGAGGGRGGRGATSLSRSVCRDAPRRRCCWACPAIRCGDVTARGAAGLSGAPGPPQEEAGAAAQEGRQERAGGRVAPRPRGGQAGQTQYGAFCLVARLTAADPLRREVRALQSVLLGTEADEDVAPVVPGCSADLLRCVVTGVVPVFSGLRKKAKPSKPVPCARCALHTR